MEKLRKRDIFLYNKAMQNSDISNVYAYVKNKLRRLRKDKLYDYSVFGPISEEKRVAFRKAVSRLAKEGKIVKLGSKKFYKKGYRPFPSGGSVSKAKPRRKDWLKAGKVPVREIYPRLSRNLFWSNPDGKIPVENLIAAILDKGSLDDLDVVRYSFGDDKVKEVFLKHFDIHKKPMIRDILHV